MSWPMILKASLRFAWSLMVLTLPSALAGQNTGSAAPAAAHAPAPNEDEKASHKGSQLEITVSEAVLLALENNRELRVERLNPPIRRTYEEQERAVFDPVVSTELTRTRAATASGADRDHSVTEQTSTDLSLSKKFSPGTKFALGAGAQHTNTSPAADPLNRTRLGLTVTQPLLRGRGSEANLALLRQARLDTLASEYELRGFAESLVARVESTYWDYALAWRQIQIYSESLRLAEQQLSETQERIRIGKLAGTELAAAEAEVARRREDLINAHSNLAATRLRLLRLVNPPVADLWNLDLALRDQPVVPNPLDAGLEDVAAHVARALRLRPDLNQARLNLQRGDLEVVRTRNGLLPKMDLFLTLGKSGYADSFGGTWRDLDSSNYDIGAGVTFEWPLGNRDARARHRRATLSRRQLEEAVENLAQLVEVDVRSAYIEVQRAREQVAATAATRRLQDESLRAETEKFRVGKSTTFLVAQAQRDQVASQIAEVAAVVTYLKTLVDLYRLEGSLLQRRGVVVLPTAAEPTARE